MKDRPGQGGPDWISTTAMAHKLGLHPTTLRNYARARKVPRAYIHPMGQRFRWRSDFALRPVFLTVPDLTDELDAVLGASPIR